VDRSIQAVKKEAVFLYSLGYRRTWVKCVVSKSCQCSAFDLGASDACGNPVTRVHAAFKGSIWVSTARNSYQKKSAELVPKYSVAKIISVPGKNHA